MAEDTIATQSFWQGVLEEQRENMKQALLDGIEAYKEGWYAECEYCNKKCKVTLPDLRTRNDAIKTLHSLAGEIPKADGKDGGIGFVLKRTLVMPTGEEVTIEEEKVLVGA